MVMRIKFPGTLIVLGAVSNKVYVKLPLYFLQGLRGIAAVNTEVLKKGLRPWLDRVRKGKPINFRQIS